MSTATSVGMNPFPLDQIPVELQKRVVGFLSFRDAVRVSFCSSYYQENLSFSKLALPKPLLVRTHWRNQPTPAAATAAAAVAAVGVAGNNNNNNNNNNNAAVAAAALLLEDIPKKSRSIPLLLEHRIHTVICRGYFVDQGWGTRTGYLLIRSDDDGKEVARSALVDHTASPVRLEFCPTSGKQYHIWYVVGGGGGGGGGIPGVGNPGAAIGVGGGQGRLPQQSLQVRNLKIEYIIFDQPEGYLGSHLGALQAQGVLQSYQPFCLELIRTLCQAMLQERFEVDEEEATATLQTQPAGQASSSFLILTNFLQSCGIPLNRNSLESLQELCGALERVGDYWNYDLPGDVRNILERNTMQFEQEIHLGLQHIHQAMEEINQVIQVIELDDTSDDDEEEEEEEEEEQAATGGGNGDGLGDIDGEEGDVISIGGGLETGIDNDDDEEGDGTNDNGEDGGDA